MLDTTELKLAMRALLNACESQEPDENQIKSCGDSVAIICNGLIAKTVMDKLRFEFEKSVGGRQ